MVAAYWGGLNAGTGDDTSLPRCLFVHSAQSDSVTPLFSVHRHYRHTARTAQYIIQLITQGSVGNRNRWLAARYCISKVWSLAFQPIPREVYGLAVIRSFDVHQRRATRVLDSRRRIINPAASSLCSVLLGVASSLAQGKLLHFHHRV